MRRNPVVPLVIAACLLISALGVRVQHAAAQTRPVGDAPEKTGLPQASTPTDQIIIRYRDEAVVSSVEAAAADRLSALSATAGIGLTYFREMSGGAHVLKLPRALPEYEVQAIANKLAALPEVEYAEPDRRMFALMTPNDSSYNSQWHYFAPVTGTYGANLPGAWDVTTGSISITVAVIDTGLVFDHPDLVGRSVAGYDFISDSQIGNDGDGRDANAADPGDWITQAESDSGYFAGCDVTDSSWHGTHVAGTIGAASNNSTGVAGINWNSRIQPVRVLGKCGGDSSDIADAIRWAAGLSVVGVPANTTPARVLNLSLGGSGACQTNTQNAINDAVNAGAVVVVAAGNSSANASGFNPANCSNVITVAANDRDGQRAFYSNYGSVVEIAAPGGETSPTSSNGILSTLNSGTTSPVPSDATYVYYQGTSMATPHVAGVVSLMLSVNPALTPAQVLNLLQTTATPFPNGSTCVVSNPGVGQFICGAGILNAAAAVAAANTSFNNRLYLPLINNSAGGATVNIPNGNFESGSTIWTQFSQQGVLPLILTQSSSPDPLPIAPHSGLYAVWLGGLDNEINYIEQSVSVPASAPYFYYWHWIDSSDLPGFDFGYVRVNGTSVDTVGLSNSNDTNAWVKRVVNLSGYAGQTITLQIRAQTDSSAVSNWFIDDVGFQSTP